MTRALVVLPAVLALAAAAPAAHAALPSPQSSVADGFPGDLLSAPEPLAGATNLIFSSTASGDVNRDGLADLVFWKSGDSAALLLLNAGAGRFEAPVALTLPVSSGPLGQPLVLRLADLDGDGNLDLFGYLGSSAQSFARLGHGDGSFGPGIASDGGTDFAQAFDLADLDGDGDLDVVVTRGVFTPTAVLMFEGAGDGSFAPAAQIATARAPGAVVARDFDSDGLPDIAFVDTDFNAAPPVSYVLIMRNLGGGSFAAGVPVTSIEANAASGALAAADMNGDDHLDLLWVATAAEVLVLPGSGAGSFGPAVPAAFPGIDKQWLLLADMERDGVPDLLAKSADGQELRVQRMGRRGSIGAPFAYDFDIGLLGVAVADLDGDGLADVAASTDVGAVLRNQLGSLIDIGYGQTSPLGAPVLQFSGTASPGESFGFGVGGLPPQVSGRLFLGLQPGYTAYQGGLLVPDPLLGYPVVSGVETVIIWPAGLAAGTVLYSQAVMHGGAGLPTPVLSNAAVILAQ